MYKKHKLEQDKQKLQLMLERDTRLECATELLKRDRIEWELDMVNELLGMRTTLLGVLEGFQCSKMKPGEYDDICKQLEHPFPVNDTFCYCHDNGQDKEQEEK